MKKILISALIFTTPIAYADTYTSGYFRDNGTYVQSHYRSDSNATNVDNYSTAPNYNPYSGSRGTIQPNYNSNLGLDQRSSGVTDNYQPSPKSKSSLFGCTAYGCSDD